MATLQQQMSDKFLAKLAESKDVDAGRSEQLKNLQADTQSLSTPDQNHQINALVA